MHQVLEDVQNALVGMLQPEFEEAVTGEAEVREVFSVPRVGKVAGCYVRSGTITRLIPGNLRRNARSSAFRSGQSSGLLIPSPPIVSAQ